MIDRNSTTYGFVELVPSSSQASLVAPTLADKPPPLPFGSPVFHGAYCPPIAAEPSDTTEKASVPSMSHCPSTTVSLPLIQALVDSTFVFTHERSASDVIVLR